MRQYVEPAEKGQTILVIGVHELWAGHHAATFSKIHA